MIVVVGHPRAVADGGSFRPAGTAALAATTAARQGAAVQLLGKIGDDDAGDALLVALTRAGVGHAAVLRDPARRTATIASTADDPDDVAGQPGDRDRPRGPHEELEPALDAADVDLGLRYLGDFRVLVAAEPMPAPILTVVADAARYAGASLIAIARPGGPPAQLPPGALLLEGPEEDAEAAFGAFLGEVAAAVDAGMPPDAAVEAAAASVGATRPG